MSEIAQRYDRVSAAFGRKAAAVPADRWDAATPCEGWTARDLVGHVVDSHGTFVGLIGEKMPSVPAEATPAERFDAARRTVLSLLEDPATANRTYEGYFGVRTFAWAVDRFLSFDLVVHGWDLARATGQAEEIDPEELARIRADAEAWGEMARAPGVFGPELAAPADADEQTRVLAFLGRRA